MTQTMQIVGLDGAVYEFAKADSAGRGRRAPVALPVPSSRKVATIVPTGRHVSHANALVHVGGKGKGGTKGTSLLHIGKAGPKSWANLNAVHAMGTRAKVAAGRAKDGAKTSWHHGGLSRKSTNEAFDNLTERGLNNRGRVAAGAAGAGALAAVGQGNERRRSRKTLKLVRQQSS